jgi:hypothetical protein
MEKMAEQPHRKEFIHKEINRQEKKSSKILGGKMYMTNLRKLHLEVEG